MHDFLFDLHMNDIIVYDIETFGNTFTFLAIHAYSDDEWLFEISDRRNDAELLMKFIDTCGELCVTWVGYNNIAFDYPVVHWLYSNRKATAQQIKQYANRVIEGDNFEFTVWDDQRLVNQIDLLKVHHFDNKARMTSLKILQFNMRLHSIEDMPFDHTLNLTHDQIEKGIEYNRHDVESTKEFYHESKDKLRFRQELSLRYDSNFINHNDTKIGKEYFIMELEKKGIECYEKINGRRRPRQSLRHHIDLRDVILPEVEFQSSEFNRILDWFKNQRITETKGVFKDINCNINGFQFDFGTGGIHGSIESRIVRSDDHYVIIDLDVASYYPNLAIVNNLYPEHLGESFCTIYQDVYDQRKTYDKGTAENAMLKLALNGVYGDSNNKYSSFYDPKYTMSITINGQLLLCMLAEELMLDDDTMMIQINTDGLTVRIPRCKEGELDSITQKWERLTGLTLEKAYYERMFIRDVNNYIAEYTNGEVKRKGAYEYELEWHQNHSSLVVAKAAEAYLLHGEPLETFINNHDDKFDFMLRTKVPRSSKLQWSGETVGNVSRYYISHRGESLTKVMPAKGPIGQFKKANGVSDDQYQTWHDKRGNVHNPAIHTKNKSVHADRYIGINTGWNTTLWNTYDENVDINHEWYIKEAGKLCKLED